MGYPDALLGGFIHARMILKGNQHQVEGSSHPPQPGLWFQASKPGNGRCRTQMLLMFCAKQMWFPSLKWGLKVTMAELGAISIWVFSYTYDQTWGDRVMGSLAWSLVDQKIYIEEFLAQSIPSKKKILMSKLTIKNSYHQSLRRTSVHSTVSLKKSFTFTGWTNDKNHFLKVTENRCVCV